MPKLIYPPECEESLSRNLINIREFEGFLHWNELSRPISLGQSRHVTGSKKKTAAGNDGKDANRVFTPSPLLLTGDELVSS